MPRAAKSSARVSRLFGSLRRFTSRAPCVDEAPCASFFQRSGLPENASGASFRRRERRTELRSAQPPTSGAVLVRRPERTYFAAPFNRIRLRGWWGSAIRRIFIAETVRRTSSPGGTPRACSKAMMAVMVGCRCPDSSIETYEALKSATSASDSWVMRWLLRSARRAVAKAYPTRFRSLAISRAASVAAALVDTHYSDITMVTGAACDGGGYCNAGQFGGGH